MYGEYIARCVFSKDRNLREHALGLVLEQLGSVEPGNAADTIECTAAVLRVALQDKMQSVVLKGFRLLDRTIELAKQHNAGAREVGSMLEVWKYCTVKSVIFVWSSG